MSLKAFSFDKSEFSLVLLFYSKLDRNEDKNKKSIRKIRSNKWFFFLLHFVCSVFICRSINNFPITYQWACEAIFNLFSDYQTSIWKNISPGDWIHCFNFSWFSGLTKQKARIFYWCMELHIKLMIFRERWESTISTPRFPSIVTLNVQDILCLRFFIVFVILEQQVSLKTCYRR